MFNYELSVPDSGTKAYSDMHKRFYDVFLLD